MNLRTTLFAPLCAVAAVSVSLAGCSDSSEQASKTAQCLEQADGYIPDQIDGQAVTTQDELTESLVGDLQREGVSSIVSGYVASAVPPTTQEGQVPLTRPDGTAIPADDPTQRLPEVIMVAAVGEPETVKQVELDPGTDPDAPSHQVDIDGVSATIREFEGQSGLNTALATAQPCESVILIVFAFKNGGPAAESAVREMLATSAGG